jgi:hypothetical protein
MLLRLWRNLIILAIFMAPGEIRTHAQDTQQMQEYNILKIWLDMVDRVGPSGFNPLVDPQTLPTVVLGDSLGWSREFFTAMGNPYSKTLDVKHSYHFADAQSLDLLRHQYVSNGLNVVVIESNNFTEMQVTPSSGALPPVGTVERKAFVLRVVRTLLALTEKQAEALAVASTAIQNAPMFSTAPEVDPITMEGWDRRIDGFVGKGMLIVLFYKRHEQKLSFPNGQTWFPADYKAAHGVGGG